MKNQALELHSLCQSRSKYARKENRVKKTEDSSYSIPSHFWSTSRSPFSTCYIPLQILGSQESNASNRVRFGSEMRKIWPSEGNCIKLRDNFAPCEIGTSTHSCNSLARKYPWRGLWGYLLLDPHQTISYHVRATGKWLKVSCNLCMPYWIRDQEGRLVRIENPQDTELDICVNIMDPPQEDQNSQHGQGGNPNAYLSMRDRMHPPRMSAPSCIVPPLEQLIIRPHIVPLLPNFHGMESENPYTHIKEFEDLCNTFREGGASIDLRRLKLFPFTLKDKAKIWLNSLRLRSIRNWVDLQAEFLKKFFPTHRTNGLKRQLSTFVPKKMRSSMNVGKGIWRPSMLVLIMALIHDSCKNLEEAMDFLSYVSEVSRGWDEPNSREMGKMKALVNPKAGMYMLSEDMDMKAKVTTMARRPNNNAPYGNTYNSSWRNHPNFSWKPRPPPYQPQAQTQAPQQTSSVEQAIVNLSKVMGDFVKVVITLRSEKEVDQPLPNVRQDEELMSKRPLVKESNNQEDKSGKKNASKSSIEEEPRIVIKEDMMKKHMPPPFSQALHGKKGIKNSSEILEVLRQVKVNIPLLDMIKQVSTYSKFLKDLCMVKRGLNVTKKAFLTEQVSAIIQYLGASVNLLPYSVYKQLGLGGLKPTTITLSLADRKLCANHPWEAFLATSNAIINCRNGVMQLTFGNMTVELNIFHLCKRHLHPEEEEGFEEEDSQGAAMEDPPKLILKTLPVDLKYAYLEEDEKCPVVGLSFGMHPPYLHGGRCKTSEAALEEVESSHARGGSLYTSYLRMEGVHRLQEVEFMTRKDHFPLPFMDQVLERVSGHPFYCFLDGYSGRMPFGLCNAPATFQRCMLSIFSDMVERIMEVFMDDITVYGDSYEECLLHLEVVLQRCIEKDLVLNWEKCHFMVQQGIVLGHIISKNGIEDAKFVWDEKCQKSFEELKQFLTTAPVVRAPNWKLPFEVMCDASDLAMGAVLGQREDGKPYVIYYASKTLNEAQKNYTTTKKELLVVVFALDKFRAYLVGSVIVVFTDHSALKYLLTKQDAKARLIRWMLHVIPLHQTNESLSSGFCLRASMSNQVFEWKD
ncbi:Retrovirus-related Pol polyprotein from transposon 17.6 [Vitis vinifera]|uniref:Retrovirus-related Pol polyprotein from transposon 17.6 n=1 Tax=Vitis vinifera TaxID=29760 RepID=A0A438FFR7_VITVI|nr:Retrovirus-related Pol polyprotein from transposon 17.6 [Vitis vinifera]